MKTYKTHVGLNATKQILTGLVLLVGLIVLRPDALAGQAPVRLGSAAGFAVLGHTTVTSTGATTVTGDLGVAPGTAVVGFFTVDGGPGLVNGTIYNVTPGPAATAQDDLTTAFYDAAGRITDPIAVSGNPGGRTLAPGLYTSTSSLEISSEDLTLDAQGDANALFIFQIPSTLTTTSGRQVILSGGAKASNIYWQVGSSATLGTGSVFRGNIMALATITVTTGAAVEGRLLALTGAVTLDANAITIPAALPTLTPPSLGPIHCPPDGSVTLVITNTPDLTLTLQTSTDLKNWTILATPTPIVSPHTFNDTNASSEATLFYRALYLGISGDSTAPTVSATVPANAATGVAISGNIAAVFSEAMDPLTISTLTFTLKQGATAVTGTVTYAGVTATFDPSSTLAPGTPIRPRLLPGPWTSRATHWPLTLTGALPPVRRQTRPGPP